MSQINVCLELAADIASGKDQSLLEDNYQKVFKGALTFLYSHPDFYLSIAFTGPQLDYYERKHPESIELLKDLLDRKQIEIIGGGYYAPVFPLINSSDRLGQIEKMSLSISSSLGKCPYGMYLFGNVWDPMLVMSFYSSGMDYVFLDSSLVPQKYLKCLPLISSEQGKSIKILPTYKNLLPETTENKKDWTKRLVKFYEKNRQSENDVSLISISIDFEYFEKLLSCGFWNNVFDFVLDSNFQEKTLDFVLPYEYLKSSKTCISAYVPSGMDWDIAKWATSPYEINENERHFPLTIHDYLDLYPQNKRLYERMLYISMLSCQCKGGDKVRKLSAMQNLWNAQCGINIVSYPLGLPAVAQKRQDAYRLLNEAERYVRDAAKKFKESLTSYDYNGDGLNEYVAFMEKYNAVVTLKGGQVRDFNLVKSSSNYATSLSGIGKYDGFSDNYIRGLFVEHLGVANDLKQYLDDNHVVTPMFSEIMFRERKLENKRKEIFLEASGLFSENKIPVTLRKNITFTQSGINVQYILKNEGDEEINAFFAVELNFAQTRFDKNYSNGEQYGAEVVHGEERRIFDRKKKFVFNNGISFIQVKDEADKRNFVIEPNEESGLVCSLVGFKRPCTKMDSFDEISKTLITSLFWNLNLAPGMEKEKSIVLSVVPVKKQ